MDYSELAIKLKALREQEKLIVSEKKKVRAQMAELRKTRKPNRHQFIREQILSLLCIQSGAIGLYQLWLIAVRVVPHGLSNEAYLKGHLAHLASEGLVAYKTGRGKNGALIRTYCITQKGILENQRRAPIESSNQ